MSYNRDFSFFLYVFYRYTHLFINNTRNSLIFQMKRILGRLQRSFATAPGVAQNWCENVDFAHTKFITPHTVSEIQTAVKNARKVRVLGSGHSFSKVCSSEETLISLAYMRNVLSLDVEKMTVTVEGGATLGDVVKYLAPRELALKNLPSLPHVSIAGAIATSTHGTGMSKGHEACLSSFVRSITFITADGSSVKYDRKLNPEKFKQSVVNLGCLGVVSEIELDVIPTFNVDQYVFHGQMDHKQFFRNYNSIVESCDSLTTGINFGTGDVTLWMRYFHGPGASSAAHATPTYPEGYKLMNAPLMTADMPFFELNPSDKQVTTTRKNAPWHDGVSFFMDNRKERNMPVLALQSEFFVPLSKSNEALSDLKQIASKWPGWINAKSSAGTKYAGSEALVVHCEVRAVPCDNLTGGLSQFADEDMLALHFTWGKPYHAVQTKEIFPVIEDFQAMIKTYHGKPHFGKMHSMTRTYLDSVFKKNTISNFLQLAKEHDPTGKFMSNYMKQVFELE
jgi:alditol oxidase